MESRARTESRAEDYISLLVTEQCFNASFTELLNSYYGRSQRERLFFYRSGAKFPSSAVWRVRLCDDHRDTVLIALRKSLQAG